MREFLNIAKALADESRVRTLVFLQGRELCLCELIELLGLAPSTVSKHMTILHQAGLVDSRKEGRWVYYRLAGEGGSPCALEAIRWLRTCAERDGQFAGDEQRVEAVRHMSRSRLCKCYRA